MKDNVSLESDTFFTNEFVFEELGYDSTTNLFKIYFIGNILYLNNRQYSLLKVQLGKSS